MPITFFLKKEREEEEEKKKRDALLVAKSLRKKGKSSPCCPVLPLQPSAVKMLYLAFVIVPCGFKGRIIQLQKILLLSETMVSVPVD